MMLVDRQLRLSVHTVTKYDVTTPEDLPDIKSHLDTVSADIRQAGSRLQC